MSRKRVPDHLVPRQYLTSRFSTEVRGCPFCGSGNVAMQAGPSTRMTCLECMADGPPSGVRQGREEEWRLHDALVRWNRRAPAT